MPERERERAILKAHASRTAPELEEFELHLKCVIEGIGKDQILVRFTHIDPLDHVREFSIVVDVTESTYKSTSYLTNHFTVLPSSVIQFRQQAHYRPRSHFCWTN